MSGQYIRRFIDIVGGSAGALLSAPTIVVAAAIARVESGQSGIFRQTRYGLHGKPFTIYKIRTLGKDLKPLRIAGRFRKVGIDELPQFFNVAKGDMSFIGPRPSHKVYDYVPGWRHTLDVKPGFVGLNSIVAKEADIPEPLKLRAMIDGYYVDHRAAHPWSPFMDIYVALKAAKIILTSRVDSAKDPIPDMPSVTTVSQTAPLQHLGY